MLASTAHRLRSPRHVVALALSLLALVVGLVLSSSRAIAGFVDVIENGLAGHLTLAADPYPTTVESAFMALSPGSVVHWQIATHLVDPSSPLTMQFKRDGELVERPGTDGLGLQVRSCEEEWTAFPAAPTCGSGEESVIAQTPLNSVAEFGPLAANSDPVPGASPVYDLGVLTNVHAKYVLVSLSVPAQADLTAQSDRTLMGLQSSFGFGFTAMGDDELAPLLPSTGVDPLGIILVAGGLLGVGLVLASARRPLRAGERIRS